MSYVNFMLKRNDDRYSYLDLHNNIPFPHFILDENSELITEDRVYSGLRYLLPTPGERFEGITYGYFVLNEPFETTIHITEVKNNRFYARDLNPNPEIHEDRIPLYSMTVRNMMTMVEQTTITNGRLHGIFEFTGYGKKASLSLVALPE